MYDDMESQSGHCLPIIYQPFDPSNRMHWQDRGFCYDYLYATDGEGKKLLDFGPGDGWPSLIVAPFVSEIIGVDASKQRVKVCNENARRLGIQNVAYQYVESGKSLPFKDNFFDGVMAASSIEQTPDPKSTLTELFRVLKPGGRLRMHYENLGYYAGDKEHEVFLEKVSEGTTVLTIYDRHIEEEYAKMYKLFFTIKKDELVQYLEIDEENLLRTMLKTEKMEKISGTVTESRMCRLYHPAGQTYISWLKDLGFTDVIPTHNGARAAGKLFGQIPDSQRPATMDEIDQLLKPIVKIVIQLPAPMGKLNTWDPMITALK
jgi:ubiquinone/menaquinone biosynthesis C-methylase UbiE